VNVSFTSYSPEIAAKVTEAIAKSFIDLNIESKFEATQQAREWLEKQLEAMKAKVEQAEERLNEYAEKTRSSSWTKRVRETIRKHCNKKLGELSTALTQPPRTESRKRPRL